MCLSPEQMSVEQLTERLTSMRRIVEDPKTSDYYQNLYSGRIEQFEQLLDEKLAAQEVVKV